MTHKRLNLPVSMFPFFTRKLKNYRYAGILMGISNTIANFPGIIAPIVVASITSDVSVASSC